MSLSSNRAVLILLSKELMNRWEQTRQRWLDEKGREFERHYLEELATSVDKTLSVIEQLDKLLIKIRNDCE